MRQFFFLYNKNMPKALRPTQKYQSELLLAAVVDDDISAARAALALGASPSFRHPQDHSLLMIAAANASFEMCNLLLESGAEPAFMTAEGSSALSCALFTPKASAKASYKIVDLLLQKIPSSTRAAFLNEKSGYLLRVLYTRKHGVRMCKLLIRNGASIEVVGIAGQTALHILASSSRPPALLSFFIKRGVSLNVRTHDHVINDGGQTALHSAIRSGNDKALRALLAAGADPDLAIVATGRTPLHLAAACGTTASVRILLAHGANFLQKDIAGRTAENYASVDLELYEILRRHRESAQLEQDVTKAKGEHRLRI
jgi:ankyrin repeat protein